MKLALRCYAALWAVTLAAGALVATVPGAAGSARGRLALELAGGGARSIATFSALALDNALVCGWPALLRLLGLWELPAVSVLVGASLALNAGVVGAALGAYGPPLVPYVVQLPIEWLALALGAAAWFGAVRSGWFVLAVLAAAALETWATPR
jgi:hypothetical protein